MTNKPDCALGVGLNSYLMISDLAKRDPWYLEFVYKNSSELTEEVKRVIEEYISIEKENKSMTGAVEQQEKSKEKPQKTSKGSTVGNLCLLGKINAIREEWGKMQVEKEGKGKAGGGAKYDYYKPQQIIDFCLKEEIKHGLFSEFKIIADTCMYNVTEISTDTNKYVECPFEVPRKMAASEAQQIGAAMTYYNRRLAMMMYKIEDNSKENVDVLGDADFTVQNIPAPIIPAPPIPSVAPPTPSVPTPPAQVNEEEIQAEEVTDEDVQAVAAGIEKKSSVAPPAPPTPPKIMGGGNPAIPPIPSETSTIGVPASIKVPPTVKPPKESSELMNGHTPYIAPGDVMSGGKKSIEDLYG